MSNSPEEKKVDVQAPVQAEPQQKVSQQKVDEESQKRMQEFKTILTEASSRLECDFYAYPQFVPREDGVFSVVAQIQIVDRTKLPQKSPISKEVFDK